jgi:phage FluMu protein gp41
MVDLVGRPPAPDVPPPLLLGPFDPVLHGWASRDFVLADHRSIVTTNGLFRAFALVRGRAVATWGLANGRVTVRPLEPIAHEDLAELRADAARVLAYLGLPPAPAVVTA